MDEGTRFVLERERGLHTMTELCEVYNITPETGYYWPGAARFARSAKRAGFDVAFRPILVLIH